MLSSRRPDAVLDHDDHVVPRTLLLEQRAFRLDQLAQLQQVAAGGPLSSAIPEIGAELSCAARAALVEVQAALQRIEDGGYGLCTSCGAPIGWARLEILPQAARCLGCERFAQTV